MHDPDRDVTLELAAAYEALCDLAQSLSCDLPPEIVVKAAMNLAARLAYDAAGLETAQRLLRDLADQLPTVISEAGRVLETQRLPYEAIADAGEVRQCR